eukprot:TRINITY_DN4516_c0_g1_i2.p4 TRINITY_DN4516_c0_g1~~TRINITY_DN4516_c0_g1_i2.p4  ORF type:complete len:124 (+),score=19.82 TRINITY_DN4516_c0_g1_i2:117-488(+)
MIRRPPRSTHCISSAASDVYKRQFLQLLLLHRPLFQTPGPRQQTARHFLGQFGPQRLFADWQQHQRNADVGQFLGQQTATLALLVVLVEAAGDVESRAVDALQQLEHAVGCLLYTSPSPRDQA